MFCDVAALAIFVGSDEPHLQASSLPDEYGNGMRAPSSHAAKYFQSSDAEQGEQADHAAAN
jgi:hypothetical protein